MQLLTSGRDDGSVGSNNNSPLELGLEVVDDLGTDLTVGGKGSEWDSNKDVLGHRAVSLLELNLLGRVDVDKLEVGLDVRVALLVVLEGLGDLFLEFGDLSLFNLRKWRV